jgi:zona occludens toxin (predicted ATPase)
MKKSNKPKKQIMPGRKISQNKKPFRKGFMKIDGLLYDLAKTHKLEAVLQKQTVSKNWENILSGFFEKSQGQTKVLDLKNGVLVVASLDKQLAYEIKVLAQRIIYALNSFLGGQFIFAIRVVV